MNFQRMHELHLNDVYGGWCFHAMQLGADEWLWTSREYNGILRANREHMITSITEAIMNTRPRNDQEAEKLNWVTGAEGSCIPKQFGFGSGHLTIDRAGNTWCDGRYMPPHEYVPLIVPEAVLDA